jgi:hypothetical protein
MKDVSKHRNGEETEQARQILDEPKVLLLILLVKDFAIHLAKNISFANELILLNTRSVVCWSEYDRHCNRT